MAIILVTGGSSGIGLAIVRRLAGAGHQVFSASRKPDRNGVPAGVTPLVLDLADPTAAAPTVDAVVEAAGGLDALVNNAVSVRSRRPKRRARTRPTTSSK